MNNEKEWWGEYVGLYGDSEVGFVPCIPNSLVPSLIAEAERRTEERLYWEPCEGCKDGHPSFWKTIVESEEWRQWEKASVQHFFDTDESRECGWFSPAHFKSFIGFLISKYLQGKVVISMETAKRIQEHLSFNDIRDVPELTEVIRASKEEKV